MRFFFVLYINPNLKSFATAMANLMIHSEFQVNWFKSP